MSSIIYKPNFFDVRLALGQALFRTATRGAVEFIAGVNKPPVYYLGVFTGEAAIATSIPGAAITLYVIAESVDMTFFKSPDGSLVDVYIDGIAATSLDTYSANAVWEQMRAVSGLPQDRVTRLDFVLASASVAPGATGLPWLAMSYAVLNGSNPSYIPGVSAVPYNTIAFRFKDSETDTQFDTVPINVPTGLQLQTYQDTADIVAPLLDNVTGSQLVEIVLTLNLTIPAGVKGAPVAASLNERGGLISFDTAGPRRDSVRIPAIDRSIMSGDSFSLADPAIAALVDWLTVTHTINTETVRAVTAQDYEFTAALKGAKSLRRR